jgi:lipopolysaccharide export system permease protein
MMPILWRYLLSQYLKVLFLCVVAFIAVLLTTRLDEIAQFIALGASSLYILWFIVYQVPYILPIALPISCLISAILLIQRLSQTHEITALRACGLSLRNILAPILIAAAFLSILNFYVISEMATTSHLTTNLLKNELRSINPLLLVRSKHLLRLQGLYFDTLGSSRAGESASDIVFAMPNKNNNRLNLMIAKTLQATPKTFSGHDITLISSMHSDDSGDDFDHLVLENIEHMTTSIKDFSQMVQKKSWKLNDDHLRMSLLLVRLQESKLALAHAQQTNASSGELQLLHRSIARSYSEIMRRISVALAIFTFTLMGAAFGISISRNQNNRGLYFVIGLATLYLISFFAAKGIDRISISALLYLLPHLIIISLSVWTLKRVTKGVE